MDFELTDTQREWRDELRTFFRDHVTPELERERDIEGKLRFGPEARAFRQKIGERGWWGVTWPKEYGGLGKGAIDMHIMATEFDYAKVVPADTTYMSIASMIMHYGTDENMHDFIPGISRGEFVVAVGYSEPDAGMGRTWPASERKLSWMDEWVIN